MDNLDDPENNAKISDSAYSNSCSNSQSRRSHSSKSTHSGSNSSSSGYGGKQSTSGSSNNLSQPPEKRSKEKETKKKKQIQAEILTSEVKSEIECRPPEPVPVFEAPKEEPHDVVQPPSPAHVQSEKGAESMDISTPEKSSVKDEVGSCNTPLVNIPLNIVASRPGSSHCSDGFSCVISMQDGVVMYTTSSLTTTLGFPKDMWIGRSFIDFIHPRDRNTFASQITNGLAVPKNVNGTREKAQSPSNSVSTMVCRIRRYRGLTAGFGVKVRAITFMTFLLKLSFKNISDEEGKTIYLVIQATPFFSAFKIPNEIVVKAIPFVMRHVANGNLEYIDPESVPYLGYLLQDIMDKDVLQLYHPEDLCYLRQVYETIVKEGGMPRSKPYRIMAQNGDYVKVETEWSSFINPWSRKLEFVIAKHHIIEGPTNPDVFQSPDPEKTLKLTDEEKNKVKSLREGIVRIMNEVLTKPAELAKQQMSKRCQDLASFMESLMEEQPKTDYELRLEIQDPDHSYYERDSVMLGGISPHHDYNDSKSSTETPLSYNQLNYNETLQRYFDSHQPYSYEDYNTVTGENVLGLNELKGFTGNCLSPMAQNSGDSGEMTSSCGSSCLAVGGNSPEAPLGDYQPVRLTEALLIKHNTEMEKELVQKHRETRSSGKGKRKKVSNETRQKKKEHFARCNALFQPTTAGTPEPQPHGVKRTKELDGEGGVHKHHCSSSRQSHRRQTTNTTTQQPSSTITTTVAATHWPANNSMNTFMPGVGIPHPMNQMSIVSPVAAVPGMFPMYYVPTTAPTITSPSNVSNQDPNKSTGQYPVPAMQYMMYGQAVFGSPFMYSPISHQMPFPLQQTLMTQTMLDTSAPPPLGLTSINYEQACKPSISLKPNKPHSGSIWREKKRTETQVSPSKAEQGSGVGSSICSSTNVLNRESGAHSSDSQSGNRNSAMDSSDIRSSSNSPKSTEANPDTTPSRHSKTKTRLGNSEETIDRTDGESSYSSFYSSFFKTESGSAEESGDAKKVVSKPKNNYWDKNQDDAMSQSPVDGATTSFEPHHLKKVARRKMEPPWMEQVCVTSELIYKYQILTKNMDEVLTSDKQKMNNIEQPSLVNEQLGQLYLDLQLEGVAARLTLEEGITSSGSSGEETSMSTSKGNSTKGSRRKREYSKLVMIYEEDAPLPPASEGEDITPSPATS